MAPTDVQRTKAGSRTTCASSAARFPTPCGKPGKPRPMRERRHRDFCECESPPSCLSDQSCPLGASHDRKSDTSFFFFFIFYFSKVILYYYICLSVVVFRVCNVHYFMSLYRVNVLFELSHLRFHPFFSCLL